MAKRHKAIDAYRQPCFDSSVFIGKMNEEICHGIKRAVIFDWLWDKAKNGDFKVFISAITLAEVYKLKRKVETSPKKLREVQIDVFLELIEEDFVEVIEVSRNTGLKANQLCREYNVSPNDGLQLACALDAKCDIFLAWDIPLIGKRHSDIKIEEPSIYNPGLFDHSIEIATKEEIEKYERESQITAVKTTKSELRGGDVQFIKGHTATEKIKPKAEKGNGKQETPKGN